MAYLKQAERFAIGAFSPTSPYIALGTVEGAIDVNFSNSSTLEIFNVEFSSDSQELTVVGKALAVPERFNRLAWGLKPSESSNLPLGILAGGFSDGSISLYDPNAIVNASAPATAQLARLQKHSGGVKGLQFNSSCPSQLASGGADGDLHIWDVTNTASPTVAFSYPKVPGPGSTDSQITHLAWNPKVQNILATTSSSGVTAVWNLKQKNPKPVISFRDSTSARRCSVLQWNPETSTQLVVASDDDRWPTLQMWDLRNSVSPLKEFVGHTKGVLGMSWCPHDLSLLLSSGKDNRTICWDTLTGDIVCELPVNDNWSFDVQWSPTIPGIFATSSFDGKVGLTSINACTVSGYEQTLNADWTYSQAVPSEARPLKHTPVWMKRPAGATFGFGNKLASFVNHKHMAPDPTGQQRVTISSQITLQQVVAENDLVSRSEAFEHAIGSNDRVTLREYCSQKSSSAQQDEEETWSFLGLLFEDDARRQLLSRLGFADVLPQPAQPATAPESLAQSVDGLKIEGASQPPPPVQPSPESFFDNQNEDSFFDNLAEAPMKPESPLPSPAPAADENHVQPSTPRFEDQEPHEHEEEIQRALFAGNYESAVEYCVKANRMADALLIANICGSELYKQTMHRYMKRCPRPYMRVITSVVDNDYLSLVKTRPVAQWRETLAVLATYTDTDQWNALCDALASRLHSAGMVHAASLCYICAGNVEQAVAYWTKASKSGKMAVEELQNIMEKAIILGLATNTKKASPALSDLVASYASLLAANGRMYTALEYLDLVPGEASSSVAVLKDRIYRSGAPDVAGKVKPMPFPFIYEEVFPPPQQLQAQQQHQQQVQPVAQAAPAPAYAGNQWQQPSTNPYPAAPAAPATRGTMAPSGNSYYANSAYSTTHAPSNDTYPPAANNSYTPATTAYSTPAATTYTPPAAHTYSAPPPSSPYAPSNNAYSSNSAYGSNYPAYTPPPPSQPSYPAGASNPYGQPAAAAPSNPYAPPPPAAASNPYAAAPPPAQFVPEKSKPAPVVAPPPQVNFSASTKQVVPPPAPVHTPKSPAHSTFNTGPPPANMPPPSAVVPPSAAFKPAASTHTVPPPAMHIAPGPGPTAGMPTSPPAAPAQPPVAAPPPNLTMQTADVSNVAADQKAIVSSLTNLFNACSAVASQPAKKREMDDNSKRIGQLFWKLNRSDVSPVVVQKLLQLAAALDANDLHTASHIQVEMTTTNWDECSQWLTALKRLIKTRQLLG